MDVISEILFMMLGEALFDKLQILFRPIYRFLNLGIVLVAWFLVPVAAWAAYRIAQSNLSAVGWYLSLFLGFGWPVTCLLLTVALSVKKTHPSIPAP